MSNGLVDRFDGSTGAFIGDFVAPGSGLASPSGIAFGADGLYVSDQANGVEVFDPATGTFITVLVPLGSAPADPGEPSGLVFGPRFEVAP